MSRPSARTARLAKWAVIPVTLLASGALVATSSYSAFSSTMSAPKAIWTAGTVHLEDNGHSTWTLDMSNLKPGDGDTQCTTVTSSGTLPASVRLYGTNASAANALSNHIKLTIVQGTGGGVGGDCTGFTPLATTPTLFTGPLATFATTNTSYATGLTGWQTTGGKDAENRSYRFSYTLDADTPNDAQGQSAAIGFTWEAQNQ